MDKESKLLKPCPFCGGEAEIKNDLGNDCVYISCKWCHCNSRLSENQEEVIEAWNTRKPIEDIVEQLDGLDIEDVYDYTEKKYFEYVALHEAIEIVKGGAE